MWECELCTLHNGNGKRRCAACGVRRTTVREVCKVNERTTYRHTNASRIRSEVRDSDLTTTSINDCDLSLTEVSDLGVSECEDNKHDKISTVSSTTKTCGSESCSHTTWNERDCNVPSEGVIPKTNNNAITINNSKEKSQKRKNEAENLVKNSPTRQANATIPSSSGRKRIKNVKNTHSLETETGLVATWLFNRKRKRKEIQTAAPIQKIVKVNLTLNDSFYGSVPLLASLSKEFFKVHDNFCRLPFEEKRTNLKSPNALRTDITAPEEDGTSEGTSLTSVANDNVSDSNMKHEVMNCGENDLKSIRCNEEQKLMRAVTVKLYFTGSKSKHDNYLTAYLPFCRDSTKTENFVNTDLHLQRFGTISDKNNQPLSRDLGTITPNASDTNKENIRVSENSKKCRKIPPGHTILSDNPIQSFNDSSVSTTNSPDPLFGKVFSRTNETESTIKNKNKAQGQPGEKGYCAVINSNELAPASTNLNMNVQLVQLKFQNSTVAKNADINKTCIDISTNNIQKAPKIKSNQLGLEIPSSIPSNGSGKTVKVSGSTLAFAEKLFDGENGTFTCTSTSVKPFPQSSTNSSFGSTILNDCVDPMYKQVLKSHLEDAVNTTRTPLTAINQSLITPISFYSAGSAKAVTVTEKGLAAAQKVFGSIDMNTATKIDFDKIVSHPKLNNSDMTTLNGSGDTSVAFVPDSVDTIPTKAPSKVQRFNTVGFHSVGSGKAVKVSESSLALADKLFADVNSSCTSGIVKDSVDAITVKAPRKLQHCIAVNFHNVGFGKTLKISGSSLALAEKFFDGENGKFTLTSTSVKPFPQSSTNSSFGSTILNDCVDPMYKQVLKSHLEDAVNTTRTPVTANNQSLITPLSFYSAGSAKAVTVTEKGLTAAQKVFGSIDMNTATKIDFDKIVSHPKLNNSDLTTLNGSGDTSVAFVPDSVDTITTKNLSKLQRFNTAGFHTVGSGKAVKVSESSLVLAEELFDGANLKFTSDIVKDSVDTITTKPPSKLQHCTAVNFFSNGSGKAVNVSESSHALAQKLFDGVNVPCTSDIMKDSVDTKTTEAPSRLRRCNAVCFTSVGSGKAVKVSKSSLALAERLFDGTNVTRSCENVKSFSQPSAKPSVGSVVLHDYDNPMSEQADKSSFKDAVNTTRMGTKNEHSLKTPISFHSAGSGKAITVSDAGLAAAQKVFVSIDTNTATKIDFDEIVPHPKLNNSDQTTLNGSGATSAAFVPDSVDTISTTAPSKQRRCNAVGFHTVGTGKTVKVSESSLAKADKLFDGVNVACSSDIVKVSVDKIATKAPSRLQRCNAVGFHSVGSGKAVKVLESSLALAEKLFDGANATLTSGCSIVKDSASTIPTKAAIRQQRCDGFGFNSAGSGNAVKVSESSLALAEKLFDGANATFTSDIVRDSVDTVTTKAPSRLQRCNAVGFHSVGSGKAVKVSESSLVLAEKLFDGANLKFTSDVVKDSVDTVTTKAQSRLRRCNAVGFHSVGSGKAVKVSESSLAVAEKLFDGANVTFTSDIVENSVDTVTTKPPRKLQHCTAVGFHSVGSGKAMKVSESSLAVANKLFDGANVTCTSGSAKSFPQRLTNSSFGSTILNDFYNPMSKQEHKNPVKDGVSMTRLGTKNQQSLITPISFNSAGSGKAVAVTDAGLAVAQKVFGSVDFKTEIDFDAIVPHLKLNNSGLTTFNGSGATSVAFVPDSVGTTTARVQCAGYHDDPKNLSEKAISNGNSNFSEGSPENSLFGASDLQAEETNKSTSSIEIDSPKISWATPVYRKNLRRVSFSGGVPTSLGTAGSIVVHDRRSDRLSSPTLKLCSDPEKLFDSEFHGNNIMWNNNTPTMEPTAITHPGLSLKNDSFQSCSNDFNHLSKESKITGKESNGNINNRLPNNSSPELNICSDETCIRSTVHKASADNLPEVPVPVTNPRSLGKNEPIVGSLISKCISSLFESPLSASAVSADQTNIVNIEFESFDNDSNFRIAPPDSIKRCSGEQSQHSELEPCGHIQKKMDPWSSSTSYVVKEEKEMSWIDNRTDCLRCGVPAFILDVTSETSSAIIFDQKSGRPSYSGDSKDINSNIDYFQTMLESYGCKRSKISAFWVLNHLRWINWKLVSIERRFAHHLCGEFFSANRVCQHLFLRYDKEINKGARSSVRRILNGDVSSTCLIILCVACIRSSDGIADSENFSVELTDGWYSIKAIPDGRLCHFIEQGKIRIGTKLLIANSRLVGNSGGMDPLDKHFDAFDNANPYLVLSTNGTRLARWNSKLGFVNHTCDEFGTFSTRSFRDIYDDGGVVPLLNVKVLRKDPLKYLQANPSSDHSGLGNRVLNESEEFERLEKLEQVKLDIIEKYADEIHSDCLSDIDISAPTIWEDMMTNESPTEFYLLLDDIGKHTIDRWKEKRSFLMQERIQDTISAKLKEHEDVDLTSIPFLQLLVCNAISSNESATVPGELASLTIWRPSEEQNEMVQVGTALKIWNLGVRKGKHDGLMQLSANGKNQMKLLLETNKIFTEHLKVCNAFRVQLRCKILRKQVVKEVAPAMINFIGVLLLKRNSNEGGQNCLFLTDESGIVVRVELMSTNASLIRSTNANMDDTANSYPEFKVVGFTNLRLHTFDSEANCSILRYGDESECHENVPTNRYLFLQRYLSTILGNQALLHQYYCLLSQSRSITAPHATNLVAVGYLVEIESIPDSNHLLVHVDCGGTSRHSWIMSFPLLVHLSNSLEFDDTTSDIFNCKNTSESQPLLMSFGEILRKRQSLFQFHLCLMKNYRNQHPSCEYEVTKIANIKTENYHLAYSHFIQENIV